MHQLTGVLFEVNPADTDALRSAGRLDFEPSVGADRVGIAVLRDLIALGQVGIEVILPVEDGLPCDRAVQCQGRAQDELHRDPIRDRERSGEAQANRANSGVWLASEGDRASAEHLAFGQELGVDLHPDAGRIGGHRRFTILPLPRGVP